MNHLQNEQEQYKSQLYKLTNVREAAGITTTHMAESCGITRNQSRTVAACSEQETGLLNQVEVGIHKAMAELSELQEQYADDPSVQDELAILAKHKNTLISVMVLMASMDDETSIFHDYCSDAPKNFFC